MEEEVQEQPVDTQHEAHRHARTRLVLGIVAFVVLGVFFFYIWPRWGESIKETCFGDGEVCAVPIPGATIEGTQE